MGGEWRESTVGAGVDILLGIAFKSAEFAAEPPGHRLVRGDNVKRGMIEWGDKLRYWRDARPDLDKYSLEVGDVVVGMDGSRVGENFACVSPEDLPAYLVQRVACLRARHDLDQAFLRYLICNPEFTAYIKAVHTGTSIPHISGTQIAAYPIPIPPRCEQRAIANILGTLDDKIELNRRMNETLEAMARAIFKAWFVDAVDSGMPGDWREGTLEEVAENPRRGVQPESISHATPYIGLEHMPRRSIALSEWGLADKLESNKFEFKRGEILFGKLRSYFHKVGVAPLDGVCSTDILVIKPREPAWFAYVLEHVSSTEFVNHTDAASTGTKMPRTSWKDMARYELAVPPKSLAAAFTDKCHPLIDRMIANIHESNTLSAVRDALLPKLISGDLRVPKSLLAAGVTS